MISEAIRIQVPLDIIILQQILVLSLKMNDETQCHFCEAWYQGSLHNCPVCETNPHEFMKPLQQKKSSIECQACHFFNDLSNEFCVACDASLFGNANKKKCEICGFDVLEDLYNQHSTNCFLSREQVVKYEEQIKSQKQLEEYSKTFMACKYCGESYPGDLMDDHVKCCPKKPKKLPIRRDPIKIKPKIEQIPNMIRNDIPYQKADWNYGDHLPQQVTARLTPLQKSAMEHMHSTSLTKHNKAISAVQQVSNRLGYRKQDIENLTFYIENYAPIIIHIHITRHMEFFIKDTHYRSQFETGKSSGSLSRQSRTNWENRLFDKKYSHATDFQRVKYGVVNFTNDPKGVNCASGYGASYLLLKEHVRPRCTITDMDSSNNACRIGTLKYCLHIIEKMNDKELKSVFNAAKAQQQSSAVTSTYKQIQIHGPVEFSKDIERIYVNKKEVQDKKFLDMVYQFSEKFKVDLEFI